MKYHQYVKRSDSVSPRGGGDNPHLASRRTHSLPHCYKMEPFSLSLPPPEATVPPPNRPRVNPIELKRRLHLMRKWMADLSSPQRTLALASIQPFLGADQYHWLSHRLPNQDLHAFCNYGCNDPFQRLPLHLSYRIIQFLDPVSLLRASQVNKLWREILDSDWIWKRLSFQSTWSLSPDESQAQINRHISTKTGQIQWKDVFKERYKLRRSWLSGKCKIRTFEGHTGGISCVQFDSDRIVSGSHDKTIRVWNMKTNSSMAGMTLTGHSGEVRCLHLEGNRLVSGSTDRTIKLWDLNINDEFSSIACKVTMTGHNDTVRCLQMRQDRGLVISGSYDKLIKVWELRQGTCLITLRGHVGRVLCLYWEDDLLLSGSSDKTIKVWSLQDENCQQTFFGHSDAITCLSREGSTIISGSLDRTLKLWDLSSGLCMKTLDWMSSEGHTGVIRCLQADSWRIVSAADDKSIKVWELCSGQRLVTLWSHTDGVTCLRFNDYIIVSGSYDKTVKLWDFTVC